MGWITAVLGVDKRLEVIMADLARLTEKVNGIAAILPNIAADYQRLLTRITALEARVAELEAQLANVPSQAEIDALADNAGASLSTLEGLDALVPPIPPPGTP